MRLPSSTSLRGFADVAIPWVVGLFLVLVALGENEERQDPLVLFVLLVLAVVQGGALRWRRSNPELVTLVALAGGLGILLLAPESVLPVAGYWAVFALAAVRPPRISLVGLAALLAVAAVNFRTTTEGDAAFAMVLGAGAWALGEAMRNRRVALSEEARRAVADEQARISRELHDVIAHSVSVIVVQAAAAEEVFDERPDQARAALRSIEQAGRDALRELRLLLGAVRPGGDASAHPQPGLDGLDELADSVRAGGLDVSLRREGRDVPLPAGVDLSAYRIVQEALTNALRHAHATRAEVTVRLGREAVELDVRDDGRGSAGRGGGDGGHGLVGMHERASLLGGSLEAGPQPEGGYRVRAHLPLQPAS